MMSSNPQRSVLCSERLKKFSGFIEQLGLSSKDLHVIWLNDYLQRQDKFSEEIEGFLCTSYHLHIIDDEFLSALPNLKVVSIASAGYDNLDVSKLHKLNIRMSNVHGFGSEPTADIAFMLMLATARRLKANMQASKHADIEVRKSSLFSILGTEVTGATLGILGMGGIGYAIAKRAVGFRMNTLYYNRTRRSEADEERVNAKYCTSLKELLTLSDFFVIAVPLTKKTTNLIGHKELDLMKPTSILINVARGRIIDTNALVDALKNGKISAAGLDVTEPEPLAPDHPLVHMDNVVLSGHSGTSTQETRTKIFIQAIENLKAGLNSGPMSNELFPSSS